MEPICWTNPTTSSNYSAAFVASFNMVLFIRFAVNFRAISFAISKTLWNIWRYWDSAFLSIFLDELELTTKSINHNNDNNQINRTWILFPTSISMARMQCHRSHLAPRIRWPVRLIEQTIITCTPKMFVSLPHKIRLLWRFAACFLSNKKWRCKLLEGRPIRFNFYLGSPHAFRMNRCISSVLSAAEFCRSRL